MIKEADSSELRAIWLRVFSSNDPFAWPFRSELAIGRLFYPTDGYHLTERQFLAVAEALQQIGETGSFISIVESQGLAFLERDWGHWECESNSYEEYMQLPLTLENTIYSKKSRWGVLVSHELHALIGGSAEFMAALWGKYRGWSEDMRLLREAWAGNPNAGWLEPVIEHIERAADPRTRA